MDERDQVLLDNAAFLHLKLRPLQDCLHFRPRVFTMVAVVNHVFGAGIEKIIQIVVHAPAEE